MGNRNGDRYFGQVEKVEKGCYNRKWELAVGKELKIGSDDRQEVKAMETGIGGRYWRQEQY